MRISCHEESVLPCRSRHTIEERWIVGQESRWTTSLLRRRQSLKSPQSMMKVPRAVLWDMDGTLIDSEELHWISWRNTLASEDVAITREQFLASFGLRNDSIIPRWLGAASTPERIERVGNAKEDLYRYLVRRDGVAPLPGVTSWLQRLHSQGWVQAIASSAPRANVEAVLQALRAARLVSEHRVGGRRSQRQTRS